MFAQAHQCSLLVRLPAEPPFTYAWQFGDGGTSTDQNPLHSFVSLGCGTKTFSNTLKVTDANGCTSATITNQITILQAPDVQLKDVNIFSPFSNCENNPSPAKPNYTLTIDNISPNKTCINSYSLDWGDGKIENGLTQVDFPRSHTYTQLGAFNLTITGVSTINGCSSSKTYPVANQITPDVGLAKFGPTEGCASIDAPLSASIIVTNWQNNSPGTIYILNYGDGSSDTLHHPINSTNTDDTLTHLYTTTSCPNTLGFPRTITAINGCKATSFTGSNILVKTKPVSKFIAVTNPSCTGQSVCFKDSTILGYYNNCARTTIYAWDFGDISSGANNTSTDTNPCHTYNTPGTYTVTLTTSNPCGQSVYTQQICVSAPPTASFVLDTAACVSVPVSLNNISNVGACSAVNYHWTVSYSPAFCGTSPSFSFANGSNASSTNPSFIFNNPGIYTLTLNIVGSCNNATFSKKINVKKPPTVTIKKVADACDSVSFCPATEVTITNCGNTPLSYAWSFDGGTLGTSQIANPPCVTFASVGMHTISVSVTNECGTTTVADTFSISGKQDITLPLSATVCAGDSVGPFNFSSTTPNTTFTWKNNNTAIGLPASGTGNIPRFKTTNNLAAQIKATISVTASNSTCGSPPSFTVTVNPKPAIIPTATISFCKDAVATPINISATTGNTLLWYTTLTGGVGDTTTPIPVTTTLGTTTYYVSQKNNAFGCESDRDSIIVKIIPVPFISGNASSNPTSCIKADGSITLKGLDPNTTYSVKYTFNGGPPVAISPKSDAAGNISILNLAAGNYTNIMANLGSCVSNTVDSIKLMGPSLPPTPKPFGNNTLCQNDTLVLKADSTIIAGATYSWTSNTNFTSNLPIATINRVTSSASGKYQVTVTVNGCTSLPGSIDVLVNASTATPKDSSNSPLCVGDTLKLFASSTAVGNVGYAWTGPNGYTNNVQNPIILRAPLTASGKYNVVATSLQTNCPSLPATTTVSVLANPKITDSLAVNPTGCTSSNGTISLFGLIPLTPYTVVYTFNGNQIITLPDTANSAGVVIIKGLSSGNYSNVSVLFNQCPSNSVGPFVLQGTPPFKAVASTPNNRSLCEGDLLNLTANPSSTLPTTYAWKGPSGFTSSLQNPSINAVSVFNGGTYYLTVTINGCPDNDSIQINVSSKSIGGNTDPDTTVCKGNNSGTINLRGNIGTTLRWEYTTNNGNTWNRVGNTSSVISFNNLTNTTWYRAVVQNGACPFAYSDTSKITVKDAVTAVAFTPLSFSTCNHDTTISFTASFNYGSSDPVNYNWYVNNLIAGSTNPFVYQFKTALTNAAPVLYNVRVLVNNDAGCGDTSSTHVITVQPVPVASIRASPSATQYEPNNTFTLTDVSTEKPTEVYKWDLGDKTAQPRYGHEIDYRYGDTGTYKVTLLVVDNTTKCTATDTISLTILPVVGTLYVPNAFYPNSAKSELRTFIPKGIGLKTYRLRVFDKWDKLVFETTDLNPDGSPKIGWDGTDLNHTSLPQGGYSWLIDATFKNGRNWDGMSYNGRPPSTFNIVTLFR